MSANITLDKPLVVSEEPRSMHHLIIELDRAGLTFPEQAAEISTLEMLYQTPATEQEMTEKSEVTLTEFTSADVRELVTALVSFTVDASCQFIALAAAMPFIPSVIGKQIYRPLVRRLLA